VLAQLFPQRVQRDGCVVGRMLPVYKVVVMVHHALRKSLHYFGHGATWLVMHYTLHVAHDVAQCPRIHVVRVCGLDFVKCCVQAKQVSCFRERVVTLAHQTDLLELFTFSSLVPDKMAICNKTELLVMSPERLGDPQPEAAHGWSLCEANI